MTSVSERQGDIAILRLDTAGFERLTDSQKRLCARLAEAGLWGKMIALDQSSPLSIPLIRAFKSVFEGSAEGSPLREAAGRSLFVLLAHGGVYHGTSGERLDIPFGEDDIRQAVEAFPEAGAEIARILAADIPASRTVQADGVDVVASSGGNFYEGLTQAEVEAFRASAYPTHEGDEIPPYGFNERLSKAVDGSIRREIVSADGLYGPYVRRIAACLKEASELAENPAQKASIDTLVRFYETGDAADFDRHCEAWTADVDSSVYFINGLIESYEDPLGVACSFESIVAFKNPDQTEKVGRITSSIQRFEDALPVDPRYKKEKAQGLSASSIGVVSMAGDASPSLPLGVNLPNSDWIRRKRGSKSVSLANVSTSRSAYEVPLREALYLPKYHRVLEKHASVSNSLHTDLHEIAGHGSCKLLDGVASDALGAFHAVIEEARADLVALYFMADPLLQEVGAVEADVDLNEFALAQYLSYLTNGAFGQLRRVSLGSDLAQAHFRNRQLIARWVLEMADPAKLRLAFVDGKAFVEIDDIAHAKELFGRLLGIVQSIKSEGDFEAARDLVSDYGTKVDIDLHRATLERIDALDMPKVVGFYTPILEEAADGSVELRQPDGFLAQQLGFLETYGNP